MINSTSSEIRYIEISPLHSGLIQNTNKRYAAVIGITKRWCGKVGRRCSNSCKNYRKARSTGRKVLLFTLFEKGKIYNLVFINKEPGDWPNCSRKDLAKWEILLKPT